ncbi:hypothetical protein M433DRAFT_161581 [Acidomyces richmondensis BFW]|nr:MAG: hypothetical protein FE78DRAFT_168387 [Acidomyces sp. 'richmondensis']KYG50623.1 hypothetical protein M433DRAFT_161581 [Acidomyces richmondensis BFW]
MSFLRRVSDSLWSYVSPHKSTADPRSARTPQTVPKFTRVVQTTGQNASMEHALRHSQSMSPVERVDSWKVGYSIGPGRKRKQLATSGSGTGTRKKARVTAEYPFIDDSSEQVSDDDVEMSEAFEGECYAEEEYDEEEIEGRYVSGDGNENGSDDEDDEIKVKVPSDYEYEVSEQEGDEEYDESNNLREDGEGGSDDPNDDRDETLAITNGLYKARLKSPLSGSSPAQKRYFDDTDEDADQDISNIIPEEEWNNSAQKRRVVDITEEYSNRGISTKELRAQGWCDDHITLVQKIAMRGFEPLMPRYFKDEFTYLPNVLFGNDDEAFIKTIKTTQGGRSMGYHVLRPLMILGGAVRIARDNKAVRTPGEEIIKRVRDYIWRVDKDSGLDTNHTIPLLAFETKPIGTAAEVMQANILRRMKALHCKYEKAFSAHKSIELSPSSTSTSTTTKLTYPIPQIYGLVASHTVVVLMAYRPDEAAEENQVRTVAIFDYQDPGYDVWNSLALAIVVHHCRNLQLRIAEETGLGLKIPGMEQVGEDPDL